MRKVLSAVVLLLLPLGPAGASGTADEDVIIAVIDSGIRANHLAFAPDQVVAWYDFLNRTPRPLAAWDPLVTTPFDLDGHGTAAASMAAGLPVAGMTPSHAPGTKLAVARVLGDTGARWADVAKAVRWSVDHARADVISMSLYSYQPDALYSAAGQDLLDAFTYARQQGVLIVLLAGNGMDNRGGLTVSWTHMPEVTADALIVGGANPDGTPTTPKASSGLSTGFTSLDPEVTAPYFVTAACPGGRTCLWAKQGTSFSTPLVTGMAARALSVARAAGHAPTPLDLENLLKRAATDTPFPPTTEGYGFLGDAERAKAEAWAASGELGAPEGPNAAYERHVRETGRSTWERAWRR